VIAYEDLDLRLQADGNGFRVFAQRGSQRADAPFELNSSLSWNLWELAKGDPREIEKRGATLFDALIRGRVRDLYHQGRGGAGSDASRGLRIRILIDPRDERLRPFVRLPWEILFDRSADANNLLALDARRPIVRMIDSVEQHVDPTSGPIRRVLLASAQPVDTLHLDLKGERAQVESLLKRHPIHSSVIEHATRKSLREAILDEAPHIVHFMGHGTFDPIDGEGVLLLEGANRKADPLHASTLASFFEGRPTPRLVILTSCLTGVPGRESTFEPFSSVAAALIAGGLSAVIAMQSEVRDKNAIRFTESLYRGVLLGQPVEAAVSEARVALFAEDRRSLDWATPVLFVRAQGGGTLETKVPEELQPPLPPPPPEGNRQQGDFNMMFNAPVGQVIQNGKKS
jgi:CHAT domain